MSPTQKGFLKREAFFHALDALPVGRPSKKWKENHLKVYFQVIFFPFL